MTPPGWVLLVWVVLGGAAGAVVRHLVGRWLGAPRGTFAVNVAGSFVLGAVLASAGPQVVALVGVGFCGALTTYSTFALEAAELPRARAAAYAAATLVCGAAAALAGSLLAA